VLAVLFGIMSALCGELVYGLQRVTAVKGATVARRSCTSPLVVLVLGLHGGLPLRVMRFLRDAHKADILRRHAGGVHEFRHAAVPTAIVRTAAPTESDDDYRPLEGSLGLGASSVSGRTSVMRSAHHWRRASPSTGLPPMREVVGRGTLIRPAWAL
jgi:hypothetical protein